MAKKKLFKKGWYAPFFKVFFHIDRNKLNSFYGARWYITGQKIMNGIRIIFLGVLILSMYSCLKSFI